MDYKYIEQLMERYWVAETTLEEESILRTFFSQKDIPAEMEELRPLFAREAEEPVLGDDFDVRMMELTGERQQEADVKPLAGIARKVSFTHRLMPLFRAAAIVAIILTLGNAAQAPWDSAWNTPADYASYVEDADTVVAIQPIQAENISDVAADSTNVLLPASPKD